MQKKLIINGRICTIDSLNTLRVELRPQKYGDVYVFDGLLSNLHSSSNVYTHIFTHNKHTFTSSEESFRISDDCSY